MALAIRIKMLEIYYSKLDSCFAKRAKDYSFKRGDFRLFSMDIFTWSSIFKIAFIYLGWG